MGRIIPATVPPVRGVANPHEDEVGMEQDTDGAATRVAPDQARPPRPPVMQSTPGTLITILSGRRP